MGVSIDLGRCAEHRLSNCSWLNDLCVFRLSLLLRTDNDQAGVLHRAVVIVLREGEFLVLVLVAIDCDCASVCFGPWSRFIDRLRAAGWEQHTLA